ncbi:MAG: prepilin-type N-terminal cleavage/methylation domain-containing protein [Gemmatimonadaceae bacterium]|nr:prepilin-type N-terminal cleavage/methylation domain-containing protein [Gemmatimonadaceae bacterium]
MLNRIKKLRSTFGFTLVEVLTALAIIAVLAAVVIPSLTSKLRDSRSATIAQTTLGLSQAIAEFKRATSMYPSNLTQLTTAPIAGTTLNICGTGNTFSSTQATLWRGPYTSRDITANGVVVGDATVNAGLRRVAVGSSTWIVLDIPSVEDPIAFDLETQFDGGGASSSTTGTIQWTDNSIASTTTSSLVPAASPPWLTNLSYYIPINSC